MLAPAEAEDAVHECYLKAMLDYGGQSGRSAKLWLFAILRTICLRDLAARDSRELAAVAQAYGKCNPAPWIFSDAQTNETQTFVAALPLPLRETIVLRECMGFSHNEIAMLAGISVPTVSDCVARARALLRHRGMLLRRPGH